MTAPLWLLGVFILVRDGVLAPEHRNAYVLQFLPPFRWYWHWYAIFGLLYLIGLILFIAPTANRVKIAEEKERSQKRVRRYQRMRQSQFHPQQPLSVSGVIAESNIEPFPMETVLAYTDDQGFIIETVESNATLRAVVIPYRNNRNHRSLRRVGDIEGVSAEISWSSWGNSSVTVLKSGPVAWLSEKREKLSFHRDDPAHKLVLVSTDLADYSNLYGVQRQAATLGKTIRDSKLFGSCWRVQITFYAESEAKPVARYDWIFERDEDLAITPHVLGTSTWKGFALTKHVLAGYDFLKRVRANEDIITEYETWQTDTAAFVRHNYSEKWKSKFLFEKHGNSRYSRTPPQPASLEDRIGRQIDTLNELRKKEDH
ncbi:MAG TPA: hypothetical protein VN951_16385 [Pyrinomonadaceae bacterium]|nr:hypothetical protein [Pyrinomonadaceae bacterium]